MLEVEDVKRFQDSVDKMSSFGEKCGLWINKFFKTLGKKIILIFSYVFFGFCVGLVTNFFKGLVGVKHEH